MTPPPLDALVVGGGPAGLAAAIVLGRHGLRVLLCERRRFPLDKPCGEGIMPAGVAHLEALGVLPYLEANSGYPFRGVRYRAAGGLAVAAPFAEGPGLGLRRTTLSAALLRRAAALPGLEIREGAAAEPVARTENGVAVRVDGALVETRLLIGADGLSSPIRRWAGLAGQAGRPQRWGARQHFSLPPWSDHVEVHWAGHLEAYVTPVGPSEVGVAFLWERHLAQIEGGRRLLPSLLRSFPELRVHLHGARPASELRSIGPLERPATSPVADGLLLIGDAAGYLDAITGEGVSLALAQALALENSVVPLLRRGQAPLDRAALAGYAAHYRRIVRPYYRFTALALFLSRHPRLARRALRFLAGRPWLFQQLLSANMGALSRGRLRAGRPPVKPVSLPVPQSPTAP
jgi:2-polyprenyl-6-methoxyphenol hydroxylase-like FAD-dependent oxidoreductase